MINNLKLIVIQLAVIGIYINDQDIKTHKYAYEHATGPHLFHSVITISPSQFYIKEWTTGFFRPTTRTRQGIVRGSSDTLILIPERISFYRRPRQNRHEEKISCKCRTNAFAQQTSTENQGFANFCDTLKFYFKNDSLYSLKTRTTYCKIE